MTARGLGCGWLRNGRRNEFRPSAIRALSVVLVTLGGFFALVGLAMLPACNATAAGNGINGIVTIGPIAPVSTPGTPASRPYVAELAIVPSGGLHLKRPVRVKSSEDGTFRVNLEPGTYVIESVVRGQAPPTLTPVPVRVKAGRFTDVHIAFDSGIR